MENCYQSYHPFVRYIFRKRISEIVKLIPQRNDLRILDAGCGDGYLLQLLSPTNYYVKYFVCSYCENL